jgi:hypothetical protein
MFYEVYCSSNNKDYVSQLRSDSPAELNFHYEYITAKLVLSCLFHYKTLVTSLHFKFCLLLLSTSMNLSSLLLHLLC